MWREASSDYVEQRNPRVQLAHNPRWAHVRVPETESWPMLVQHGQKELKEMEALPAGIEEHKAARQAESTAYASQLQGYTAEIARFKEQFISKQGLSTDGPAASSSGGGVGLHGSEAVADKVEAMEPCLDDGQCSDSGDGLDDEPAPSGV